MSEELLAGVSVLAMSGAAWLAYAHPAAYKTIVIGVIALMGAVMIAATFWYAGAAAMHEALIPHLRIEDWSAADAAYEESTRFTGYVALYAFAAVIYLNALLLLPRLLTKNSVVEKKEKDPKRGVKAADPEE